MGGLADQQCAPVPVVKEYRCLVRKRSLVVAMLKVLGFCCWPRRPERIGANFPVVLQLHMELKRRYVTDFTQEFC